LLENAGASPAIPFGVLKTMPLPGDIRRRTAEDLSIREIEILCASDSVFNQQACQNPAFWRQLINKYLISDPVKAEEYYRTISNFSELKTALLDTEKFIAGNSFYSHGLLSRFDIPLRTVGNIYPSPLLREIRYTVQYNIQSVKGIIPFYPSNSLEGTPA
jgi:hypothetical protein